MADEMLSLLRGETSGPPPLESAVLVVVDGLGAIPLRAHAGHARSLTSRMAKKDVADSVFPTTTAVALTSILTGAQPGRHGLVGYAVRDPERDTLVNQLSGWDSDGVDPLAWQTAPTVFERAAAEGRPSFAVGLAVYARSGFTRAVLRGAEYVAAATPAERVEAAYELAERHPGSFVYCYLPEVDKAGHKHGIDSTAWIAALEEIDAALAVRVPSRVGVIVTSDHGMVDVPAARQVLLDETHLTGVRHVGGEPRMLHVYLEPEVDAAGTLSRWRADLDGIADVVSRDEAIAAGLFGAHVSDAARERIGDLMAIARSNRAIYDGTAQDQRSRGMIGQHGALTPEEHRVPLIRLGALAR